MKCSRFIRKLGLHKLVLKQLFLVFIVFKYVVHSQGQGRKISPGTGRPGQGGGNKGNWKNRAQEHKNSPRFKFPNGVTGRFDSNVNPQALETLALQDQIGKEWLGYGKARMAGSSAKKYAQLKTVMLAYQKWQSFGKFDYYACYCFPEGMNLALGKGEPMDQLDQACKRWAMCYQCAELDPRISDPEGDDTCVGRETTYKFIAKREENTGLPNVQCWENGGHDTCERAICECDAEFIKAMAKYEDKFNVENHQIWGNFDARFECNPKNKKKADSEHSSDEDASLLNVRLKVASLNDTETPNNAKLRSAAQESLDIQLENSNKANGGKEDRGLIDTCCVKEYPKFTLYRKKSQHCCRSEIKTSLIANAFHLGEDKHGNTFVCCKDGHVVKSDSDCVAGLHTEF